MKRWVRNLRHSGAGRATVRLLRTGLYRMSGLEWLVVGAAAPLLVFPTLRPRWTAIALGVLAAMWLLRWLVRREPWPVTPFNGTLLLFVVMIPIALRASAFPDVTWPEIVRVVLGLSVFRAVASVARDRRSLGLVSLIFCLMALVLIAIGMVATQWSGYGKVGTLQGLTSHIPHLIATLPEDQGPSGVNPNHLAGALVLYLPLSAVVAVRGSTFCQRPPVLSILLLLGGVTFFALVTGTLVLTQSRSAWIGSTAGLIGLVVLAGVTAFRRWVRVLSGSLPVLAIIGLIVVALQVGPERILVLLDPGNSAGGLQTSVGIITLSDRMRIWIRAIYVIHNFPFTGCGLGAFQQVVHFYPIFSVGLDTEPPHAHNIFLQTALDLGIPGLVAYLALLIVALAVCWRAARRRDPLVRPLALGLAGGLIALHTYGMTDALALGSKPAVVFWFALGLIAALSNVSRKERAEPQVAETPIASSPASRSAARWAVVGALLLITVLIFAGGSIGWRALRRAGAPPTAPSLRLSLYPDAQDVSLRAEIPAANAGWAGLLEVATFVSTHPLAEVVAFYTDSLAEEGWVAEVQAGDENSWESIYRRDTGQEVCLLNAFRMEGETRVSIVCGDKATP